MKRTRWSALSLLVLLAMACQPAEESATPAASTTAPITTPQTAGTAPTTQWQCRNDLEISCDAEHCEASDSFTPMDVQIDDAGAMSVCAYTGCWEGTGTVTQSERFVVLTGHDLSFSTAPDDADSQTAIVIALDKEDHVAVLKAGSFAHPLLCETRTP